MDKRGRFYCCRQKNKQPGRILWTEYELGFVSTLLEREERAGGP